MRRPSRFTSVATIPSSCSSSSRTSGPTRGDSKSPPRGAIRRISCAASSPRRRATSRRCSTGWRRMVVSAARRACASTPTRWSWHACSRASCARRNWRSHPETRFARFHLRKLVWRASRMLVRERVGEAQLDGVARGPRGGRASHRAQLHRARTDAGHRGRRRGRDRAARAGARRTRLPPLARGHLPRPDQRRLRERGVALPESREGGARRGQRRPGQATAPRHASDAIPAARGQPRLPAPAARARGLVPAPVRRSACGCRDPPRGESRARQEERQRRALAALDQVLRNRDRRADRALHRGCLCLPARAALLRRGRFGRS